MTPVDPELPIVSDKLAAQRKSFFEALFSDLAKNGSEYIEIRILGEGIPPASSFFSSIDQLLSEISVLEKTPYSVFFGVCARGRKKGTKQAVTCVRALWVDFDDKDFVGGEQEILKKVDSFPVSPSILVRSGHGYHGYWILREPETNKPLIETYLRRLTHALGGDMSACEAARILRVPGTLNRKEKNYPAPVTIVRLESDRTCNLTDFDFLPEAPKNQPLIEAALEDGKIPSAIQEGKRDIVLTRLAGVLHRKGIGGEVLYEMLETANKLLCKPPVDPGQLQRISRSISNYPTDPQFDLAANLDESVAESKWINAKALAQAAIPDIPWILRGFLGLGLLTLLSARPKAGKTTLLFHTLKSIFNKQSFFNLPIALTGKVLLLSEEPEILIQRRIQRLGLDHIDFEILFRYKLKRGWEEALGLINEAVDCGNIALVIIDTLSAFWNLADENDASSVVKMVQSLQDIAQKKNVAILIIHHLRKMGGEGGAGHRGSSALPGAVDIAFELHDSGNTRRTLKSISRFEETPSASIIELNDDEYIFLGSADQVERDEVKQKALDIVPGQDSDPINRHAIMEQFDEPKPSMSLLKEVLAELARDGLVEVHGKGVKNSPFLYRKASGEAPGSVS